MAKDEGKNKIMTFSQMKELNRLIDEGTVENIGKYERYLEKNNVKKAKEIMNLLRNTALMKAEIFRLDRQGLIRKAKRRHIIKKKIKRILTINFSSLFLFENWEYLMSYGLNESLCYITGIVDKKTNTIYPTKILKTKMSYQDPMGVEADTYGTYDSFDLLDTFCHPVTCLFHKHPGGFIPSPSSLDIDTQGSLEKMYGNIIGGIFVKSGYIKFFSVSKKFRIEIFGKGVKRIGPHTYKLDIKN